MPDCLMTANATEILGDDGLFSVVIDGFVVRESQVEMAAAIEQTIACLLYTSPSPRDLSTSRMPSSA